MRLDNCKIIEDQCGYILGLVMIFFVVFTMLGLAFIKMGGFERLHVSKYHHRTRAFYLADGGIHKGMWLLNNVSKVAATFSNDSVNVTYDSLNLIMKSVGISGGVQDSIKAVIVNQGTFKIDSWEEL